jgi:hypothetical protein
MGKLGAATSEYTGTKQTEFRRIFSFHTMIVRKIWDKYDWARKNNKNTYMYLDLFAGPGKYLNDKNYQGDGSPVIAVKHLQKIGIKYEVHLFNEYEKECDQLENIFSENRRVKIHRGDNIKTIKYLYHPGWILGLAYFDPNNVRVETDLACDVVNRFKQLDILYYFGAAYDKRVDRALGPPVGEGGSLIEKMKMLNKDKWFVREPIGNQQYSFLLGTNGNFSDWKRAGWFDINSDSGNDILEKLNYTNKERQGRLL